MPLDFNEYDDKFQPVSEKIRSLEMSKNELEEWKVWAEEWIKESECTNTKQDSSES